MVTFARVRAKSLLLKLWPLRNDMNKHPSLESVKSSNEDLTKQLNENRQFLDEIKYGGAWFS